LRQPACVLVDGGHLCGGDLGRLLDGLAPSGRTSGVGQLPFQLRDALLLRELAFQLGDALLGVLLVHQQMIALRDRRRSKRLWVPPPVFLGRRCTAHSNFQLPYHGRCQRWPR
jgi:hypothetical protein